MAEKEFSHHFKLLAAPGLLYSAAIIIFFNVPDFEWVYSVFFVIGTAIIAFFIYDYKTYNLSEETIHITGIMQKYDIHLQDIISQHQDSTTYKGDESITWKLKLKSGNTITIISDRIKNSERFKEVFNWFLRSIPREDSNSENLD